MCIPGFVFGYSKKFRRNWRRKVHYMPCHVHEGVPLRYVCGQTIDTTAMISTFFESLTDLDVDPRARFALFGQNRRNWRCQSRHPRLTKFAHVARTDEVRVLLMTIFFCSFFNILVCKASFIASRAQIPRNRATLTYKSAKYRVCLLCLYPGGVHCVTFAVTPITAQQNYGSYIFGKP